MTLTLEIWMEFWKDYDEKYGEHTESAVADSIKEKLIKYSQSLLDSWQVNLL